MISNTLGIIIHSCSIYMYMYFGQHTHSILRPVSLAGVMCDFVQTKVFTFPSSMYSFDEYKQTFLVTDISHRHYWSDAPVLLPVWLVDLQYKHAAQPDCLRDNLISSNYSFSRSICCSGCLWGNNMFVREICLFSNRMSGNLKLKILSSQILSCCPGQWSIWSGSCLVHQSCHVPISHQITVIEWKLDQMLGVLTITPAFSCIRNIVLAF